MNGIPLYVDQQKPHAQLHKIRNQPHMIGMIVCGQYIDDLRNLDPVPLDGLIKRGQRPRIVGIDEQEALVTRDQKGVCVAVS